MQQQCGNCHYGLHVENEQKVVVCRRYPPTITKVISNPGKGDTISSHFPIVAVVGWCGEWGRMMSPSTAETQ